MSESNGQAVRIDQSEDFVRFEIDGVTFEADLYAAHNAMAKIDVRHRDDLWECFDCQSTFNRQPDDLTAKCPGCGAENTRRDECWLDDVAGYVKSIMAEQSSDGHAVTIRCGRRAAAQFYTAIVDHWNALKKKSSQTPGSLFGSEESTPPAGSAGEKSSGSNS